MLRREEDRGMVRFTHRIARPLAALAALGALIAAPGCDWLKGSDNVGRSSPFITSLGVSRSSVLCGTEFSVSFRYDDPQGDIFQAKILLQHEGDASVVDESQLWPDTISRSAGTASFPLSFSCGSSGGRYTITVTVEDDLGHTSNELTGSITLSAAG
jgi:hypothetical protein